MSRIGRKPVTLPSGVTVEVVNNQIVVRGSKGELKQDLVEFVTLKTENGEVVIERENDSRQARANHGLIRSLVNNMVKGVSEGFERRLEMVGTGYRAAQKGAGLNLSIGFSHPVIVDPVPGITFSLEGNNIIIVNGIDKHLVGQVSANIRKIRPPEPYKGKGIRYVDEVVRRKQGKAAAK
jgi:large subunit ribosomal protein L6